MPKTNRDGEILTSLELLDWVAVKKTKALLAVTTFTQVLWFQLNNVPLRVQDR